MKTPVEQAPAPLVSDERMRAYNGDQLMDPEDVRYEYESDRAKMRAERDELVEKAKEAEEYLVMALGSDAFVRTPDPIQRWIMKARALLSKYKTE